MLISLFTIWTYTHFIFNISPHDWEIVITPLFLNLSLQFIFLRRTLNLTFLCIYQLKREYHCGSFRSLIFSVCKTSWWLYTTQCRRKSPFTTSTSLVFSSRRLLVLWMEQFFTSCLDTYCHPSRSFLPKLFKSSRHNKRAVFFRRME